MSDRSENDGKQLSFSQREGKVALPDSMKLGYVSRHFRVIVWRIIYTRILNDKMFSSHDLYDHDSTIKECILAYQERILEIYYDELKRRPADHLALMRSKIQKGDYHEILSLVEFFLRFSLEIKDRELHGDLLRAFEQSPLAYFVDDSHEEPTICPRQDKISGLVVATSLNSIREGGLTGPEKHLRKAAEFINEGRYEDSIGLCCKVRLFGDVSA